MLGLFDLLYTCIDDDVENNISVSFDSLNDMFREKFQFCSHFISPLQYVCYLVTLVVTLPGRWAMRQMWTFDFSIKIFFMLSRYINLIDSTYAARARAESQNTHHSRNTVSEFDWSFRRTLFYFQCMSNENRQRIKFNEYSKVNRQKHVENLSHRPRWFHLCPLHTHMLALQLLIPIERRWKISWFFMVNSIEFHEQVKSTRFLSTVSPACPECATP